MENPETKEYSKWAKKHSNVANILWRTIYVECICHIQKAYADKDGNVSGKDLEAFKNIMKRGLDTEAE